MAPTTKILIVEDEEVLAENLRSYLSRRAEDVRVAFNGTDALALLDTFSPDVVVMDYSLPGMDGVQTYAEICRRRAAPLSCVMVTGHPSESVVESAQREGIRHVLGKPFSFSELLQMITTTTTAGDTTTAPGHERHLPERRATDRRSGAASATPLTLPDGTVLEEDRRHGERRQQERRSFSWLGPFRMPTRRGK